MIDPDQEITVEVPPETMAEIAKQWHKDLAEMATHSRPTVEIRIPRK
jgi:hypothetical protein